MDRDRTKDRTRDIGQGQVKNRTRGLGKSLGQDPGQYSLKGRTQVPGKGHRTDPWQEQGHARTGHWAKDMAKDKAYGQNSGHI